MSESPFLKIERAIHCLSTMPPAISGERGHDTTYAAAHVAANGFALDEDAAVMLLLAHFNPRCREPWSESDLRHKVRDALNNPGEKGRGYMLAAGEALSIDVTPRSPIRRKWPDPELNRITEIVDDGLGALDLWKASPVLLDVDDGSNCAPIVQIAFADAANPDPFLCVGKNAREFFTRPMSAWIASNRLDEFALIVPATMTTRTGHTKSGKQSEHTLANTGPRRFVVVEFDFAETNRTTGVPTAFAPLIARWKENDRSVLDACAALLWYLDGYAPLALVAHSGGKSLHGWFPVVGNEPAAVERFMRHAARIGADAALFRNPSQFVRLPGGTRETGCRQSVFYYAPDALVHRSSKTVEGYSHE